MIKSYWKMSNGMKFFALVGIFSFITIGIILFFKEQKIDIIITPVDCEKTIVSSGNSEKSLNEANERYLISARSSPISIDQFKQTFNEASVVLDSCLSGLETSVWYMGNHGLSWSTGFPVVDTGFIGRAGEAQTSICDRNGILLFYTDNDNIYNRNHTIMDNGDLYKPGLYAGASSTMNLIIPLPDSDSIYYLFYPDQVTDQADTFPKKLRYAIIDISQNNGLGKVIQKHSILMDSSSERVEGIQHCNGNDWWVIGQNAITGEFRTFLVNNIGIDFPSTVINYSGFNAIINHKFFLPGYLKSSPNGQYLIEVTPGIIDPNTTTRLNAIEIHKFDPNSGNVFNGLNINPKLDDPTFVYGAEFSPDLSKIYINGVQKIWQLDISQYDSSKIASSLQLIFYNPRKNLGAMTLGVDGKIYCTKFNPRDSFLGVINFPNRSGLQCQFNEDGLFLGGITGLGSPHFAQSMMFPYKLYVQGPNSFCADSLVRYILLDPCPHPNAIWSLPDGGEIKNNLGDTIDVFFTTLGNRRIIATYFTPCGDKSDTLKIEVKNCNCHPYFNWVSYDTLMCQGAEGVFKYKTNADSIWINNYYFTKDSFILANFNSDTCLQFKLNFDVFCDSSFSLCIKQLPKPINYLDTVYFCENDSVLFRNIWYKDTITLMLHDLNNFGCDSFSTFFIKKYSSSLPSQEQKSICYGDSALINNIWYFKDTIIALGLKNIQQCDSTHFIHLKIHSEEKIVIDTLYICSGDSVSFLGTWYKDSSKIIRVNKNIYGCDSNLATQLLVYPIPNIVNENYYLCSGDSIQIASIWYKDSARVIQAEKEIHGCDSIIISKINLYPKSLITHEIFEICPNDSILINNIWYYDSVKIQQRFLNQFGCDSFNQIQILLKPSPEPVELSFYFCQNDSVLVKNSWHHIETNFSERKSSPFSCDTFINYNVFSYKYIFVDLGQDLTLSKGDIFTFNPAHSANVISYKWSPSIGLSCTDCPSPKITVNQDITYYLEVSDQNGCIALDSIKIRINELSSDIYVPNVFSPNGDNINDVWMPVLSDSKSKILNLSIYDRWGNRVFDCEYAATVDLSNCGWNGLFNGKQCLPGVYIFVLRWQNDDNSIHNQSGNITLIK